MTVQYSMEIQSISITKSLAKTNETVPSGPLFSSIITLFILILLYFPNIFEKIVFSPVFIFIGIIFLSMKELKSPEQEEQTHDYTTYGSSSETNSALDLVFEYDPNKIYADSFVGWDVTAPLEVIDEAYEGEEEDDDNGDDENDNVLIKKQEKCVLGIEGYRSLSLFYPERDTDSSLEDGFPANRGWDSPGKMGFKWEEDDGEGFIEIALDGKGRNQFFEVEDDNLIEIDIFPARKY